MMSGRSGSRVDVESLETRPLQLGFVSLHHLSRGNLMCTVQAREEARDGLEKTYHAAAESGSCPWEHITASFEKK